MKENNKDAIIKENDKYILQKIENCSCTEKDQDEYILICEIKQKRTKLYKYQKNQDFITDCWGKVFYLSFKAKDVVNLAIKNYENELVKFDNSTLDYIRIGNNRYFVMMKKDNKTSIKYINGANELAHYVLCNYDDFNENKKSILEVATKKKDRLLELRLKVYYCDATLKDINELEELTHKRVLPCLSDEYNKNYYVIRESIDFELLENSGYKILHRPYFSMMGCTHSNYSLNPVTKKGVDGAQASQEAITFDEYLKLFD